MCEFVVKIAGYTILIRALHPEVKKIFENYLTEEAPQITIESSESGIIAERQMLMKYEKDLSPYVDRFSDSMLESSYLHHLLVERLSESNIVLMHGSAIALDGETYIFVAPSGTGKSTHTHLWCERFGDRAVMVNDDKPLLKCTGEDIFVYGSPWNGKHHRGANISMPLKAICFLERGTENHMEQISSEEAFFPMLVAVYHSNSVQNETCILQSLQNIRQKTAFYRLRCNMEPDAARVSYEGMRDERRDH